MLLGEMWMEREEAPCASISEDVHPFGRALWLCRSTHSVTQWMLSGMSPWDNITYMNPLSVYSLGFIYRT